MTIPPRPRYYLFGFSPQAVVTTLILFPVVVLSAIVLPIAFLFPPDRQQIVSEQLGRIIGTILANVLMIGWAIIAIHATVSLIVGGLFGSCYLGLVWLADRLGLQY